MDVGQAGFESKADATVVRGDAAPQIGIRIAPEPEPEAAPAPEPQPEPEQVQVSREDIVVTLSASGHVSAAINQSLTYMNEAALAAIDHAKENAPEGFDLESRPVAQVLIGIKAMQDQLTTLLAVLATTDAILGEGLTKELMEEHVNNVRAVTGIRQR
jgi:hypothetical protein